ncbi:MAG: chemotaxis protein CheX [Leptospiraceae bacterium]|jgi:chemotaxis protein CheX|nr:chemotaxis protein CheX [Leptospiraceae bacterium]NCN08741.1 chemotaxis protein CheX [Leptospira sp.]MCZ8239835.1 chemotaxis protein CheX [Leptospiraceae bacterium]MCZ8347699.1 chemotaxis protein CheX [Leptospiraceae bacterium]NCS93246.1 chemotaxis protein CheX [Leptospira sp.]
MQIKADFINPFLEAATIVFRDVLQSDLIRGKIGIKDSPAPSHELAIIVGVIGSFSGEVVYSMNYDTAYKISGRLVPGMSLSDIKNEYKDMMGEIANMTTGNAMNIFTSAGQSIEITTPNIVEARSTTIKFNNKPTLQINLYSKFGRVEVNVAIA